MQAAAEERGGEEAPGSLTTFLWKPIHRQAKPMGINFVLLRLKVDYNLRSFRETEDILSSEKSRTTVSDFLQRQ